MPCRDCVQGGTRTIGLAAAVLGLCVAGIAPGAGARADGELAERAGGASALARPSLSERIGRSSDYQPAFHLDYFHRGAANDCQVPLPPVGAISPFPLALRLGAMVSPRGRLDVGIDGTIKGLNLIQNASSRVDLDVILSANFHGVSTLVPLTFDQIFQLKLPAGGQIYAGGGLGVYFSDTTRFGGKLIIGAEFSKIGVEGNIHFSGSGDPLYTVQARIGL